MGSRAHRWLNEPGAVPRLAVILSVGVATAALLVRYPAAISELGDLADRNASQSYTDREIAGGNSVTPSQELVYQARARIGEDEAFEVGVGAPLEGWPGLYAHAETWARYFLLPRRFEPGAPWLICLNCGPASGEVVWEDEEEGVSLVRRG